MIEAAERRDELSPGQTVVEYTSGSTGSSLAFVCAIKGYPMRIVSSNAFAEEKLQTMRAFGADLELIHSDHGGAFLGTVSPIKDVWPGLIRTIVEPAESAVIAGGEPGAHRIEGGGIGFVPKLITPDVYDRLDAVSTEDAFTTARDAARIEGVWTGPSGGANILASIRLARELGPGHRVVTVQPDSGLKYLGGDLYG